MLAQLAGMTIVHQSAAAAVFAVMRQACGLDDAAAMPAQIAKLAFDLQPALPQYSRRYGCVIVGGKVQIDWSGQLEAGTAGIAHGWRQQAGMAPIINRKIEIRRI